MFSDSFRRFPQSAPCYSAPPARAARELRISLPNKKRQLNAASGKRFAETGTKTGKTLGLPCWLVKALLKGEACSYVGTRFFCSLRSFSETKKSLQCLHCESHHPRARCKV